MVSFRHNGTNVFINSQRLWQHTKTCIVSGQMGSHHRYRKTQWAQGSTYNQGDSFWKMIASVKSKICFLRWGVTGYTNYTKQTFWHFCETFAFFCFSWYFYCPFPFFIIFIFVSSCIFSFLFLGLYLREKERDSEHETEWVRRWWGSGRS